MTHVADDPDDATFGTAGVQHDFSEWILSGPQRSRHRLIDHDDGVARRCVTLRDVTSGKDGNPHRGRIAVAHDTWERRRVLPALVDHAFRTRAPRTVASER